VPSTPSRPGGRQAVLYWPAVLAAGAFAALLVGGVIAGLASQRASARAMPVAAAAPEVRSAPEATVAALPALPLAAPVAVAPATPAPPRPRAEAAETEALARRAEARSVRPASGERYGTAVTFLCDPADAAAEARRQGKLLFVLHLSGNFEDSQFT
jgi:hypothetical protein